MPISKTTEKEDQVYSQLTDHFVLNEVMERISDAFVALDNKWCYTYMNKKAGEIFNRDPKTMIGKNIWTEFPERIDQPFYKACNEAMEKQHYVHIEEYYQLHELWLENRIYPSHGGLSIFFCNITDKKKAEESILKTKSQYQTLAEISPVGIFHTDVKGHTTYVNKRWCQISGLSFEQALGDGWFNAVHKDDRQKLVDNWRAASKVGETSFSEYRFVRPDGEIAWVMGHATPRKNSKNEIVGYVGTITDITERKKAEEILNQNRVFIESIINASPDIIYIYDIEQSRNVYINEEVQKSLGYTDAEIKEMGDQLIPLLMHPADFDRYISNIYPTYATTNDKEIITSEFRLKDKNQNWHWYFCRESIFVRKADGTPVQIFGIMTDITEQKIAEKARRESEEKYRTLVEQASDAIFLFDHNGNFLDLNTSAVTLSGYTRDELFQHTIYDLAEENHLKSKPLLFQELKAGTTINSERKLKRKDGTIVDVEVSTKLLTDGRFQSFARDITDRKKAEEEIAKIHKENETVLNRISDAMVSIDNEWRYTFLNDAALSTHPAGREETIGKVIWDVHPEMKGTVFWDKYHEAMETKKAVEIEDYYAPMDIWFSVKVYPSHDGLTIFYKNITERKKVEEALNQNRIFIESILNSSPDIIYIYDIEERKNIYVNEGIQRNLGYTDDEIKQMGDQLLPIMMHPEDLEYYLKNIFPKYVAAKDKEIIIHEFRMRDKNGKWHWLYCKESIFLRTPNGSPKQIFGITSDITERKKIEDEILKEKYLSESVINSMPGIFYLYDQNGNFLRWNKNFETVSGYSASEIAGMHPLDFFCEDEKDLLKQKIAKVFEKGMADVEACFFTKDSEKIPYYFNGWSVILEGKSCLIGVGIDITEVKKAEEEIKQTSEQLRKLTTHLQNIRDEERKRIGREIHDELGQQLTAVKMDVAWIDKKTPEESAPIKTKLRNIITLLDTSNLSVRKILNELRADILDNHGLKSALEWQGRRFTANTGIPLSFDSSDINIKLEEPVSNCIFRVFQEALTNITKYAEANNVVSSLHFSDNEIVLEIKDDGKGFDTTLLKNNHTFGILGIKERVTSLNGKFDLISSPGRGTKIIITIPV